MALLLCAAAVRAAAHADEIPVGVSPIVTVQLTRGNLTLRTWNRPTVQIVSAKRIAWRRFDPAQTQGHVPSQITSWAVTVPTPRGPVTLPAESFLLPPLAPALHEALVARGAGDTTITLPADTALIVARVRTGHVTADSYRGVLIVHVFRGSIALLRFAGTAYAQVAAGRIVAVGSSFDRLRARAAVGNLFFEACSAQQIDATTVRGSIVYDNGTFAEGPAYFASAQGSVAIGVAGGNIQIDGRSTSGNIVSAFDAGTSFHRENGHITATLGTGGPVVTADARRAVLLYNGRLRDHPHLFGRIPAFRRFPRGLMRRAAPARIPHRVPRRIH